MRKALFALFFFLSLLFPLPKTAFAETNFSTDYNVTYAVNSSGNTRVDIKASLKNLSDKYYAASYSVQVGFSDIKNIYAYDESGPINPKVIKTSKGSSVSLDFNKSVVGVNNKLDFGISFDTSEVAQNFNNVWDINIPGISAENDFSSFNVNVLYPQSLGSPTYIKPALADQSASRSAGKLFFTKQELGESGISIAFGSFQVYNFNLTYHLANRNLFPIATEIALPPSTNYQDVVINSINPKPLNVKLDKDGNYLAQYTLPSSSSSDIHVLGEAKVYLNPRKENLSSSLMQDYLRQQQYWEVNNPKIVSLAKELKTPYAIYQYVVKTLNYDYSRVQSDSPRLGAVNVLQNPNSAVCLEFTDLFVALARAAGIPAREINGYAYTNNSASRPLSLIKDILHAWPEYYDFDKNEWIMVDPTWGNTTGGVDYFNTLDFDHIAFTVNGENSNYPVPAGGYKTSRTQNTKDVDVALGGEFSPMSQSINARFLGSTDLISGIPFNGELKIENLGNQIIQKGNVNVSAGLLEPRDQSVLADAIPPYGYILVPVGFSSTNFLTNKPDTIKITIGNYITYENVRLSPFFFNKLFLLGGLIIVSFAIIISLIAYIYRRISVFRQRQQNLVRREG